MTAANTMTVETAESRPGSVQRFVGRHSTVTLYHGDCLDVLPTLEGVDAIICDPPYGVTNFEWDCVVKQQWLDACLAATAGPVAMANATRPDILRHMLALTPSCERVIAWRQPKVTAKGGLFWSWQPVFVWRAKDFEGWDTVEYPTDGGNYVHPTQKPVQLMAWLMKVTQSGKTICDPFMGSGTTGLACLRTGRNFIGIERDAAHYKTACDRIAHELDGALL